MHGPTDISPVGMAAAMHLGLAIHNFGIQEYMKHGSKTDQVFEQSFTWTDGYLHPGENAGLGVELERRRGGQVPVRAGLPAVQPAARRHGPRLVNATSTPLQIAVMGVTGAGKTTIAQALAAALDVAYSPRPASRLQRQEDVRGSATRRRRPPAVARIGRLRGRGTTGGRRRSVLRAQAAISRRVARARARALLCAPGAVTGCPRRGSPRGPTTSCRRACSLHSSTRSRPSRPTRPGPPSKRRDRSTSSSRRSSHGSRRGDRASRAQI